MLNRFADGLKKTRSAIAGNFPGFAGLLSQDDALDSQTLGELEEALILADVGAQAAAEIIDNLSKSFSGKMPQKALARTIADRFVSKTDEKNLSTAKPQIVLVVGVNGSGKTTTIAKIAHNSIKTGGRVIMAAADTFRAAAREQLEHWAGVVGAEIVRQAERSDPAAVAFDAVKAGIARNTDLVLIDTAGRLQTKTNLMEELKKIKRVIGKAMEGAPHEILMVMDATTGQNGLSQINIFNQAIGLTGIVVAKLDGTAKGGVLVAAAEKFGIPIKYVGLGEKPDDLVEFDPVAFAEALVGIDE
jgi:fused signal recognition particle receptor